MTVKNKLLVLAGTLLGVGAGAAAVVRNTDLANKSGVSLKKQGRGASNPAKLSVNDWKRALLETKNALGDKNLPMLAAGVAFFATLAFFPTMAAFVAIFALVAEPPQITATIQAAEAYLPRELAGLVNTQLQASTGKQTTNIVVATVSVALAIWGASGGVQNMIKATNEAYGVDESRSFVKLKLVSILLVLGGIITGFPLLFLVVVQGEWLTAIGAPGWLASAFVVLRWVLVTLIVMVALAAFYRYGPDRSNAKWQWVSWGAVAAVVIWLLGTLLFFYYAQNLGNFSKSYGIFAGIIILMTWLNLTSLIFLLGAQVNNRLEAKTSRSTTS